MTLEETKTVGGVAALMMQAFPKEEDFVYEFRKLATTLHLATMLLDVTDTFLNDADSTFRKIQLKGGGNIRKLVNKMRNHVTAIHGIVSVPGRINFTGDDRIVERQEDMEQEIYELIKAYMDHTDDGEGFKAILNGIKRRKLHRHIFEK